MTNGWLANTGFWRSTVLTAATLSGLAALAWASPAMYTVPHYRPFATWIGLMRSRVVIYNPGVTGYYERLFGAPHPIFMNEREFDVWSKAAQDVIYDRTIRMRRFRPNLTELHNSSQPQGLTTNSFGFLGPERSLHKPPNTRRVAVLGDSVAQGWGVDQRRSFVSLLEDRLNAERPAGLSHRFEVLNFAVTGYELPQILDVAEEDVPRFEPDVCILALTELAVFRTWDEHLAWAIRLGIDPKYDSLRETISRSGASRDDGPLVLFGKLAPFRIPVVQAILAEMKLRALRSQVPFLVVLVPSLEDGGMSRKRFSGIPELLASLNIPVVDLQDTFDGILDLEPLRINPFDVHPSARAHAMILENLYAKLRAQPDVWTALVGTAPPAF